MEGLVREGRAPSVIVVENVVGAITSHGGKDFANLFRMMARAGYRVGPLVMDAVRFLPQSRPRLFVVAARADLSIPGDLTRQWPTSAWHPRSLRRAWAGLPPADQSSWVWWHIPEPDPMEATLAEIIEDEPYGVKWHSEEETDRLISLMSKINRRKLREVQKDGLRRVGTVYRRTRPDESGRKVQRAEARFDDISGCLRTPVGGSSRQLILVVEGRRVRSRLLAPREAARLMGVPDDYPLPRNYNEAYHLFGDGARRSRCRLAQPASAH